MAKEDEDFSFETIAQVYREERGSTTLTKLPLHFYQRLTQYLERLHNSYLEERKNDPSSPKSIMLEDEYNKAQKRSFQIYEHRERKIILLALQAANGGKPNLNTMTKMEKNAFDTLVDILLKNRSRILSKSEEDACETKTFLHKEKKVDKIEIKDEIGGLSDTNIEENMKTKKGAESFIDDIEKENPIILILEDMPSFETGERTFNLKKDDVITLPKKFSKILCRHGKARVIKG